MRRFAKQGQRGNDRRARMHESGYKSDPRLGAEGSESRPNRPFRQVRRVIRSAT